MDCPLDLFVENLLSLSILAESHIPDWAIVEQDGVVFIRISNVLGAEKNHYV